MHVKIDPIKLGICTCFLLQGDGIVLVDCGDPNKGKDFLAHLERLSIKPEEIRLIVITHGDNDHVGSLKEIKAMTGAPVAAHREDRELIEKGIIRKLPAAPNLMARCMVFMSNLWMKKFAHFDPANVDIELGDEDFSLRDYGVPATVISTPGHSKGSVSVLLDTGDALMGDSVSGGLPTALRPGYSFNIEDMEAINRSWQLLLDRAMKTAHPAHGKPFSADIQKGYSQKPDNWLRIAHPTRNSR